MKEWEEYIKPWPTCLRRDSIIVSFCLICAIRYSRLLIQGEKSDDGVGEGIRDSEGETERVEKVEGDEQRECIARESGIAKRCGAKLITGVFKGLHLCPSFLRGHKRIMPALREGYGKMSYRMIEKKKHDMKTWGVTNFGATPRFRPSTMQTWPPFLHRLHVSSSFGKSHFIC